MFSPNGLKQDAVTFESQTPVPTKWERFNDAGAVELSAEFLDYISTPAGPFPSRIQIEARLQKRKLEIRYQEPEINASLPPEIFTQEKPAHARGTAAGDSGRLAMLPTRAWRSVILFPADRVRRQGPKLPTAVLKP